MATNGTTASTSNGLNGVNGHHVPSTTTTNNNNNSTTSTPSSSQTQQQQQPTSPPQSPPQSQQPQSHSRRTTMPYRSEDFLSNTSRFNIIESTLREGEQFANAFFDTEAKIKVATALSDFGVEYIELTSPAASPQSKKDIETICGLGLKSKILTHTRCNLEDARLAVECGVDGVDVVIGTSSHLRKHSHGKDMDYITKTAIEVIRYIKSQNVEVRFSSEDSFRSDLVDLLSLYKAVDREGVHRVGVADTVGVASPRQVYELVRTLRGVVSCDIEVHFHNDTGCAIANAHAALEAGATHVDTSVLGIGERNGIPSLGGFLARMIVDSHDYVTSRYKLKKLKEIEDMVAEMVQVNVPFNNPVTGFCAFTHKAGIHQKAILNDPSTYEAIAPSDFGISRYIHFGSRLTGWNAIKSRVEQLGLEMSDEHVKILTQKIKAMGDIRPLAIDDTDSVIRGYHYDLVASNGDISQMNGTETLAQLNGDLAKLEPVPSKELPNGISDIAHKVNNDTVSNLETAPAATAGA